MRKANEKTKGKGRDSQLYLVQYEKCFRLITYWNVKPTSAHGTKLTAVAGGICPTPVKISLMPVSPCREHMSTSGLEPENLRKTGGIQTSAHNVKKTGKTERHT